MNIDLVLAPNPGPLTGPGTNTWVVSSEGEAVVIDPGPVIESHIQAIEATVGRTSLRGVLVTHTHPDHAPAANRLADHYSVPAVGSAPGPGFSPDRRIADGESVVFGRSAALCVATPGHTEDSVCFRVGDALFTGDHIMGGSTVVVEDMTDYMQSLRKLEGTGLHTIHPGHGPVIDAPDEVIAEYIAHRIEREHQVVAALRGGASTLGEIVLDVYADLDPLLAPVAAMSVTAHLQKLRAEEAVSFADGLDWESEVLLS